MAFFSRTKLPEPGAPSGTGGGGGQPARASLRREAAEPRGVAATVKPRTPLPTPAGARSRKQTLSSPIPAMLAASMLEMTDDAAEVTSVADDKPRKSAPPRGRSTPQVLLPTEPDDGDEYVVELVPND